MNWDWDKLQDKRRRQPSGAGGGGGEPEGPNFDGLGQSLQRFKNLNFPAGKLIILLVAVIWLLTGIYIIKPGEVGMVLRFGKYHRSTLAGPHYHFPYPIESVTTANVQKIREVQIGFRRTSSSDRRNSGTERFVPEEALMLTKDDNIISVTFLVQYQIDPANPADYEFKISDPETTVKDAAEAAMREVVGHTPIDDVMKDRYEVQTQTHALLQEILDRYNYGEDQKPWAKVTTVKIDTALAPLEVRPAFKDVASALEDKSTAINQGQGYRRDLLPRARGDAAKLINDAKAYQARVVNEALGSSSRFLSVLKEYNQAPEVTRQRLFLEAMEHVYSNPTLKKIILSDKAMANTLPLLPLDRMLDTTAPAPSSPANEGGQ